MDLFDQNNQQPDGTTRAMPPVKPAEEKPSRRRRTERFAGLIDEADCVTVEDVPQREEQAPEAAAQETQASPAVKGAIPYAPEGETTTQPRVPSQGVPRPAALSGQRPYREQNPQATQQGTAVVRRPVKAEGYAPLQQLGEQPRARRPEAVSPLDNPRRARTPETERVAYENPNGDEEKGSGRVLVALIVLLLVIGALVLGLCMIDENDPGVLGDIKRTVTAPIAALFGNDEEEVKPPVVSAGDFTATISRDTAPYKVVFQIVTSSGVSDVRVVNDAGEVVSTVTTRSVPNNESSISWTFEMTAEESFEGDVQAQMYNGESWVDTGLWQHLMLTATAPATVSEVPMVTQAPTPTQAPSDGPAVAETATPAPEVTPTPETTPAPQEQTAEAFSEVTATPTMSVTATPTLVPTATPTVEPTAEPTEEPTAEPTAEPTEEPSATPEVTPKLEAMAAESADPSLISETVIYKDDRKVKTYERAKPIDMPAADAYVPQASFGVTTYRGNAFRQNAAVGTVDAPASLTLEWTVEAGSVAGSSRSYYGIGWTGQPVIVRWPADIRRSMNVNEDRLDQKYLTEVIVAGMDGNIYFLDLLDGTATRDAIKFGYPMRATPSVHPLGYPMLTFGQYARKMKNNTSDSMGLYYYNLADQKKLRLIDGIDRKLKRPYSDNASGAFDTSALIDRSTKTLVAVGTNGLLYTETLDMRIYKEGMKFEFKDPSETVTMMSHTKGQKASGVAVESSLAMYANYAFYADLDGVLRCVDTTTMTTAWAVDTGDSVRAAIALDLEEGEDGNTLWLYTADQVNNRTKGNVNIRRYNAMTGEADWTFTIHCAETKKKDVSFNAYVTPGVMASPVIGQQELGDLVYFTLSSVSATGAETLSGDKAIPGVIVAFSKATGEVVWHKSMDAYCYSSPVAVYDENGQGWIIQACSNGTIYLLDGLTGKEISTLQVNGVIEGSPAVYGDTMVIGTTGKGTSYIYGVKIN